MNCKEYIDGFVLQYVQSLFDNNQDIDITLTDWNTKLKQIIDVKKMIIRGSKYTERTKQMQELTRR
jgi:hypothetical protein